jgi:hypothetical protein
MARKEKNIHYLYKTTCLITNRYYIGMHSTYNLEDGYMGSGKRLRRSIRKYGVENHVKEILEFFENRDLLIEAEKKSITPEMLKDKNCMNLMAGGEGGFISEEQQRHRSICANKKHNEKMVNDLLYKENWLIKMKDGLKKAYSSGKLKPHGGGWNRGILTSDETKNKMSETSKGMGIGEANSQYGTCWINKGGIDKKIKKQDFELYLSEGWDKGKTPKIDKSIIIEIKNFYSECKSYQKTANKFGISKSTIVNYIHRF